MDMMHILLQSQPTPLTFLHNENFSFIHCLFVLGFTAHQYTWNGTCIWCRFPRRLKSSLDFAYLAHLGTIDISNSSNAKYESPLLRDEQFSQNNIYIELEHNAHT